VKPSKAFAVIVPLCAIVLIRHVFRLTTARRLKESGDRTAVFARSPSEYVVCVFIPALASGLRWSGRMEKRCAVTSTTTGPHPDIHGSVPGKSRTYCSGICPNDLPAWPYRRADAHEFRVQERGRSKARPVHECRPLSFILPRLTALIPIYAI